jgi:hypothetical protein
MTMSTKPLSLVCHCSHAYDKHHNSGISEGWAEECEHYGSNETGGLDRAGAIHCLRYTDNTLPDEARRTHSPGWRANPPADPAVLAKLDAEAEAAMRKSRERMNEKLAATPRRPRDIEQG